MKNGHQDLLGADTVDYDKMKSLQMMPLPENMTVMVIDTDEDNNIVMRDAIETSRVYCLVLVEDAEGQRNIFPYDLSLNGGIDLRGYTIPIRKCPNCNKRLRPRMLAWQDDYDYICDCGHHEETWPEIKMEDKTNE